MTKKIKKSSALPLPTQEKRGAVHNDLARAWTVRRCAVIVPGKIATEDREIEFDANRCVFVASSFTGKPGKLWRLPGNIKYCKCTTGEDYPTIIFRYKDLEQ